MSRESEESTHELRRIPKSRELNFETEKNKFSDHKGKKNLKEGAFEYLRDPNILKTINIDKPALPTIVESNANITRFEPLQNNVLLSDAILGEIMEPNHQGDQDVKSHENGLLDSDQVATQSDQMSDNYKITDPNDYTSTGITKKVSYDVIQLPRKPRRLQKKSMEYVKSKTTLQSLKKTSNMNLARRSRELMQYLSPTRSTQVVGPRAIPKEFINKR